MKMFNESEYSSLILPRNELNDQDERILINIQKRQNINIEFTPSYCHITTSGTVGLIQLSQVRINYLPKFENLASRILFLILITNIDVHNLKRKSSIDGNSEIPDLIAKVFIELSKEIFLQGFKFDYIDHLEISSFLKGKIDLLKSYQISQGLYHKFHQHTNEYSGDIVENRIILAGLNFILKLPISKHLKKKLYGFHSLLSNICDNKPESLNLMNSVKYNRSNWYYKSSIEFLILIISKNWISTYSKIGSHQFESFLVNMPYLFEEFVGYLLNVIFAEEVSIQKQYYENGSIRDPYSLTDRGVRPDYLLSIVNENIPIDVKYKSGTESITTSDIYQLHFYSQIWKNTSIIFNTGRVFNHYYIHNLEGDINQTRILIITLPTHKIVDELISNNYNKLSEIKEFLSKQPFLKEFPIR